ncbi:hypothetical protein Acr_08g0011390 [Actinidia rufa]|uniref:Uncharacterized protein n=1 Tax=Actinidia rufa TaxID=165716 RepID=A0A7J0F2A9_9ERIC|nr:hypothetical protein Acr_08g0011390 [Actinidia rufa]
MDTSNLIKEVNIMTQGDLDKLREKCSFPPGIQLRIPGEGETIQSSRPGEVVFYEASFPAGLRFPIHPITKRILNHYKICSTHSPNAWRSIVYSLVIWRYYKCHMSCDEFRCLYSLIPLPNSGWYYFKARPDKNLLRVSLSNVKGWKKRFSFASGDEWEFFPSMPSGEGIPRVPRSWRVPEKHYNKLLALIENEAKRTAEVLEKIEPGGYFEVALREFQDPFSNLFPSGLSSRSDSKSKSLSDSGVSLKLRSDAMSSQISLSMLTKKAREKKVATKDRSSAAMSQSDLGMTPTILPQRRLKSFHFAGRQLGSRGFDDIECSCGLEDIERSDPFRRQGKGRPIYTDELVTKSFHALGQAVVLIFALALWSQDHQDDYHFQLARADSAELEMSMKTKSELKEKFEAMARLEAEMAELTGKLTRAKKLAIEEFKSSDNFKDAVTDFAATYFGEDFEFCKRQLLYHHPNLGVNLASMEMDTDLAEEAATAKVGKKEEDNEGKANPTP